MLLPWYYYYDYSTRAFIFDLNCTGTEETILDCPYIERGSYSCNSYYDAALICQSMWIPSATILFHHLSLKIMQLVLLVIIVLMVMFV